MSRGEPAERLFHYVAILQRMPPLIDELQADRIAFFQADFNSRHFAGRQPPRRQCLPDYTPLHVIDSISLNEASRLYGH